MLLDAASLSNSGGCEGAPTPSVLGAAYTSSTSSASTSIVIAILVFLLAKDFLDIADKQSQKYDFSQRAETCAEACAEGFEFWLGRTNDDLARPRLTNQAHAKPCLGLAGAWSPIDKSMTFQSKPLGGHSYATWRATAGNGWRWLAIGVGVLGHGGPWLAMAGHGWQ